MMTFPFSVLRHTKDCLKGLNVGHFQALIYSSFVFICLKVEKPDLQRYFSTNGSNACIALSVTFGYELQMLGENFFLWKLNEQIFSTRISFQLEKFILTIIAKFLSCHFSSNFRSLLVKAFKATMTIMFVFIYCEDSVYSPVQKCPFNIQDA